MKKVLLILLLCLIITPAFGQLKPMLGRQIDILHHLSGFVGAWFFLEGSGNKVFDLSGNGNDGIFGAGAASPSWVPGKFGSTLSFDGGDIISTPLVMTNRNLTFVAWVNTSTSTAEGAFFGDTGGTPYKKLWLGALEKVGKIAAFVGDGSTWDTFDITVPSLVGWHQVGYVLTDTDITFYVDGIAYTGGALTKTATTFTVTISPFYHQIVGQIDHVMIWNRALSPSEFALLYQDPFCMFTRDNVALMITEAAAPPSVVPTLYYYSRFTPILAIIAFCFILGRKNE